MNPERTSRWGDSRIEAELARIDEELHEYRPLPTRVEALIDEMRSLRRLPERLSEFSVKLDNLARDVGRCFESNRETNAKLDAAEEKREKREEEQRQERKSDRKWMVGSALVAAGLVISALAFLHPPT